MLCGSLDGREVWGRMDTSIWMAESLHCSPDTITTLLIYKINYKIKCKIIQNKKLKKAILTLKNTLPFTLNNVTSTR